MVTDDIPDALKSAMVTPIYKKYSTMETGSILSIIPSVWVGCLHPVRLVDTYLQHHKLVWVSVQILFYLFDYLFGTS